MSTLTENRLRFFRQGTAITAATTAYPLNYIVDGSVKGINYPDNSNTNGVRLPERYANQRVAMRATVRADDACTAAIAVYGYVRTVVDTTNTGIGAGVTKIEQNPDSVLTGSIDPAASTTVTGVGTAFDTELVVGDYITVTGETRQVTAIASATSLTVGAAFTDNANDTSPDRIDIEKVPWDHLLTLNSDGVISTTTQAVGGVSVIDLGGTLGFRFNASFLVGGMYEWIRAIPVVLTGTNVRCLIDFGFGGGQR